MNWIILVPAIFLTGCALTPASTNLTYTPINLKPRIAAAAQHTVNVQVRDERQIRDRVGSKKNGYGMELAPIRSATDVPMLVRTSVQTALRERGFKIGSAGRTVHINLISFSTEYNSFSGGSKAELIMNVSVSGSGYSRDINATGSKGGNYVVMTIGTAQSALDSALANGVEELVNDPAFIRALGARD